MSDDTRHGDNYAHALRVMRTHTGNLYEIANAAAYGRPFTPEQSQIYADLLEACQYLIARS